VPEFCINDNIFGKCKTLTKNLIEHLEEIMFCHQLTTMSRARNTKLPKREIIRSEYQSMAPNSQNIRESIKRKKSIKCKRSKKTLSEKTTKSIGRFKVTAVNQSQFEKTPSQSHTVNKVKKLGRFTLTAAPSASIGKAKTKKSKLTHKYNLSRKSKLSHKYNLIRKSKSIPKNKKN